MKDTTLAEKLGIVPGITAVIGSGGKTTLLMRLAEELSGRVILTTSTRVFPFENVPLVLCGPDETEREAYQGRLEEAFEKSRIVCTCCMADPGLGKLGCVPFDLRELLSTAEYILVEADGSKHLPIKAHASYEPVIPEGTVRTICIVGASGFGKPIATHCHRPEIFCELTGSVRDDAISPEKVGEVIRKEGFADCIYLSQTNCLTAEEIRRAAEVLRSTTGLPVVESEVYRQ